MDELLGLWGKETQHFHLLSPDNVMAAVEGLGKRLTGRIQALNSLAEPERFEERASAALNAPCDAGPLMQLEERIDLLQLRGDAHHAARGVEARHARPQSSIAGTSIGMGLVQIAHQKILELPHRD